jgi:hypothetical protein
VNTVVLDKIWDAHLGRPEVSDVKGFNGTTEAEVLPSPRSGAPPEHPVARHP